MPVNIMPQFGTVIKERLFYVQEGGFGDGRLGEFGVVAVYDRDNTGSPL